MRQAGQGRAEAFSTSWLYACCACCLGKGRVVTPFSLLDMCILFAW